MQVKILMAESKHTTY